MDYEKAYKEMVQRARELHEAGNALTKQQMEIVCPELAESEDKRVNEEIRNFLIDMECKREWIAYLEKQKEQKPAECGEEDETVTDIDLIQKSWYRQGYIDGINKQEPQWILENLRYKENPKYGQPPGRATRNKDVEGRGAYGRNYADPLGGAGCQDNTRH